MNEDRRTERVILLTKMLFGSRSEKIKLKESYPEEIDLWGLIDGNDSVDSQENKVEADSTKPTRKKNVNPNKIALSYLTPLSELKKLLCYHMKIVIVINSSQSLLSLGKKSPKN